MTRSVAGLDEAALEAVKHWRYAPALRLGTPVAASITITINSLPPTPPKPISTDR